MTKFSKDNFDGKEYVMYKVNGALKFVARFKRGGKGPFITFLIKNFTVEEYMGRLDADETPLAILQSKGYLQPHVKKMLKEGGYPVNIIGFDQMIKDQIAARP